MNLYLLSTQHGNHYVVSTDPTSAQEVLLKEFENTTEKINVINIKFLSTEPISYPSSKNNKNLILPKMKGKNWMPKEKEQN